MTHALGISEFIPAGMLTIKIRVGLRFDCKARRNSVDAHENTTYSSRLLPRAQMAELVDALRSGRSVLMDVEVRVLFWAPHCVDEKHSLYRKPIIKQLVAGAFRVVPCSVLVSSRNSGMSDGILANTIRVM